MPFQTPAGRIVARLVPYSIIFTAFALRAARLNFQSLWRDEVDVLYFSNWSISQLIQALGDIQHNGPLYYLLVKGWKALAGESEFGLRYLSVVCGVLSVPLAFALATKLHLGKRTALVAALLVGTSPFMIWYSQDAKMYALLATLVLGAAVLYLHAVKHGRLFPWLVFGALMVAGTYIHLLSSLMIGVFLLAYPWLSRRGWRSWLPWLVAVVLLVPYLPRAWGYLQLLRDGFDTGHAFYPLPQMLSLILRGFSAGIVPAHSWLPLAIFIFPLLALAFLRPSLHRGEAGRRMLLLPILWLAIPFVGVYLVSLRAPVFEVRYLIFLAPAFYVLVAHGLETLQSRLQEIWLAALIPFLLLNLLGVYNQSTTPIKPDMRSAAALLRTDPSDEPVVMLQMPYMVRTFSYYYGEDFRFLEGPWTNDDRPAAAVGRGLAEKTSGLEKVWLILTDESLWDARQLTRQWFMENTLLLQKAHFTGVDVFYFQLE